MLALWHLPRPTHQPLLASRAVVDDDTSENSEDCEIVEAFGRRPDSPKTKGGICVSTVSIVCTTVLFSDPSNDGLIIARSNLGSTDDADGADGIFSTHAHPDHSRPCPAFTR
jgi:hypothetical protein